MKKIIVIAMLLCVFAFGITASAEENVIKISMDGETKVAKDIGNGKGISFTLPELDSDDFYICAVELAVFEKREGEDNWHIYTDSKGKESKKKFIENPKSLNFSVDFGNLKDYRDRAKYKIAYRYHTKSIHDSSLILIAGEDVKDGWRLVGEDMPDKATEDGFVFYRNAIPEMTIEGFTYKYHDVNGLMTKECTVSGLEETYFPYDVFENGIIVQMFANDFDTEDILTVSYVLEDAHEDEVIESGNLPPDFRIATDRKTTLYRLYITVTDNYGGTVTSEPLLFMVDCEQAYVVSEFDDGGFALKGRDLFSDFTIADDEGELMEYGKVIAYIYLGQEFMGTEELANKGSGIYRLDKSDMPDGKYTVTLKMFDKAGNESEHTFYQTLDSSPPVINFVARDVNPDATYYSKWMNESKYVIVDALDKYAGIKEYKLYENDAVISHIGYDAPRAELTFKKQVTKTKTGKLVYRFYVCDNAKEINKSENTFLNSAGNAVSEARYVWLDKTKPSVTTSHTDDSWKGVPYTVTANYNDYPSDDYTDDASGIKERMYTVTATPDEEPVWLTYTDGVTLTEGGVYYIRFRAMDNAGNIIEKTQRIRMNTSARRDGRVRPTDDYKHTIYYSTPGFYVVKNTAYNTKYHFELTDADISDSIKTNVKLVSQDDSSVYAMSESITLPNGSEERDIVFNMAYLDADLNQLPDGVYDMLVTVTEIKSDSEEIVAYANVKECEVVIKRNAPPTPVITVNGDKVSITYPEEILSGSLNNSTVRTHYKCRYKTVKDGEAETNSYMTYTGEFDADNFIVTALYIDIAGNASVATSRINIESEGGGGYDILTSGNTITVEESRAADVYYIGIRRDKESGIDNSVFDFLE